MDKLSSAGIGVELDYSPFGMVMPNRSWEAASADGYRFGFNGKESDSETYGDNNIYDYGFRIYNPRLGRFLSVDPLSSSYPYYTPYQYAGNKPIMSIDRDGLEDEDVNSNTNETDPNGTASSIPDPVQNNSALNSTSSPTATWTDNKLTIAEGDLTLTFNLSEIYVDKGSDNPQEDEAFAESMKPAFEQKMTEFFNEISDTDLEEEGYDKIEASIRNSGEITLTGTSTVDYGGGNVSERPREGILENFGANLTIGTNGEGQTNTPAGTTNIIKKNYTTTTGGLGFVTINYVPLNNIADEAKVTIIGNYQLVISSVSQNRSIFMTFKIAEVVSQ